MYVTYVIEGRRLKTNTKSNANKKGKNEDLVDFIPPKRSKSVVSSLSDDSRSNSQSDAAMRFVSEYSGLERTYDEYDRYEDILDANANEYLVTQDAGIIRSETKITDTQGRNKTLVRTQQR
jgi:hypothetical protein